MMSELKPSSLPWALKAQCSQLRERNTISLLALHMFLVDPTGAGDVFMGGFLTEYLREKESVWCSCVGSAAASLVVEGIGPTYFGSKEKIYQRAKVLYEKELKQ